MGPEFGDCFSRKHLEENYGLYICISYRAIDSGLYVLA